MSLRQPGWRGGLSGQVRPRSGTGEGGGEAERERERERERGGGGKEGVEGGYKGV